MSNVVRIIVMENGRRWGSTSREDEEDTYLDSLAMKSCGGLFDPSSLWRREHRIWHITVVQSQQYLCLLARGFWGVEESGEDVCGIRDSE